MITLENSKVFPKEILKEIISYLSPQEKKISALVCTRFKLIAEDPHLLLADFKKKKDLSLRQLSIVFYSSPGPDSAYGILKKMTRSECSLSEKNLKLMLSFFKIPPTIDFMSVLRTLEYHFRKSMDFNSDNAVEVFYDYLKDACININRGNFSPSAPLHTAAEHRSDIMIKALVKAGAAVNIERRCWSKWGFNYETTASLLFSYNDGNTQKRHEEQTQCLEILIEAKADLTAHDRLVLWEAIKSGNEQAVKRLVDYGLDINKPNDSGYTPVQFAAEHHQTKIVKLLSEAMAIQQAAKKAHTE